MENKVMVEDIISKRNNNLSLSKFIAACLVIVSHAYPLCFGKDSGDFLTTLSNGQLGLGGLAVGVFFFSSGLFIARSVEKNKTTKKFFYARILRIFPPLITVIIGSALILGILFSTYALFPFLSNQQTWQYLLNMILIPVHALPGVFEANIYGNVVNGALWTLPVEFLCYVAVFIAYKVNLLSKKMALGWAGLLLIVFLIFNYMNIPLLMNLANHIQPVMLFGVGVVFYIFREKIKVNIPYGIVSAILFIVSIVLGFSRIGQIIFFPYCFMCLVMATKQCSDKVAKLGNISYGLYLVGFPIQQSLIAINGGTMNVYINMILAIIIAILFAIGIYYTVEKPLLKN